MLALLGLFAGAWIGDFLLGRWGTAIGGIAGFLIGVAVMRRREGTAQGPPSDRSATTAGRTAALDPALAERVVLLEQRVDELERTLRFGFPDEARHGDGMAVPATKTLNPPLEAAPTAAAPAADPLAVPGATGSRAAVAHGAERVVRPASVIEVEPVAASSAVAGDALSSRPPELGRFAAPRAPDATRPPVAALPPNPVWAWIAGGNTLARSGVVLLFIGVGFLLKYAAEHVHVPITVRLTGVALGGVALLVVGWRLRVRRRAYAMVLQGGGVGVLYLTVFAALRLYALVPPLAAFALLVWISALSSWLAVRQDAISLAALAVAGGFLAPILTSSETGNHVMLFSYYALLNAGILGIAWFKAWRSLNLLGFAFTFLVGTFWGVTRYRPENFATTEPFLVLFFLFYVAIAVLYALRRSVEVRDYVDAGLVFGTPLVAAGLQSALVYDVEYGMAYSALAMSALYLGLGRFLYSRRKESIRLLVESFLALGVVFATLAVPLGLDARWTSAAWAVEGAAILWSGVRQQRVLMRAFGLLLEFGAGVAFALGLSLWMPATMAAAIPVANSAFVGAVLVSLAGLFSAWRLQREKDRLPEAERAFSGIVFAWGVLWWLFAGWHEIDRFVPPDMQMAVEVGLVTATAIAFAAAERPLRWPMARFPAWLLLPALFAIAVFAIAEVTHRSGHVFAHGGFVAWPVAVAAVVALLHRFDRSGESGVNSNPNPNPNPREAWHAGLCWLVLLLAAHELAWVGSRIAYGHGAWSAAPWGLVPAFGLAAISALASGTNWPVGAHRRAYVVIGAIPVAVLLAVWSLAASVHGDGNPTPLPYFPLANPLDLTQAIVLIAGAMWAVRVRREDPAIFDALPRGSAAALLSALVFLWVNAIALRTIHFWYDVPYTVGALWRSMLVQTALSLLWSSIALGTMAFANRRQWRAPWTAGAALLGVVVAKLFLVELAQVGTITRIVSFIGVGLLLLLIGYLAPLPPRRKEGAP